MVGIGKRAGRNEIQMLQRKRRFCCDIMLIGNVVTKQKDLGGWKQ